MADGLVTSMERLLVKVEALRKTIAAKEEEVNKLRARQTARSETRQQDARRQDAAVQDMLQNVRKKQHEVKNMESLLDAKRQALARAVPLLELQEEAAVLESQDEQEEEQIETKRGENVRLEASVKRLDKQIRAKEDELQGKTAQLNTCRQQTARAQERASTSLNAAKGVEKQLMGIADLNRKRGEFKETLSELNQVTEDVDDALQFLAQARESMEQDAFVDRQNGGRLDRSETRVFEETAGCGMWFGSANCAVATLRLRRLQERRSGDGSGEWLEWLGSQQVALSLTIVNKRHLEAPKIGEALVRRKCQLHESVDLEHQRLATLQAEVEENAVLKQELEEFIAESEGIAKALEGELGAWDEKLAHERQKFASLQRKWENAEADAAAKYGDAMKSLQERLSLLTSEQDETVALSKRLNEEKRRQKEELTKTLQRAARQLTEEEDKAAPFFADVDEALPPL